MTGMLICYQILSATDTGSTPPSITVSTCDYNYSEYLPMPDPVDDDWAWERVLWADRRRFAGPVPVRPGFPASIVIWEWG